MWRKYLVDCNSRGFFFGIFFWYFFLVFFLFENTFGDTRYGGGRLEGWEGWYGYYICMYVLTSWIYLSTTYTDHYYLYIYLCIYIDYQAVAFFLLDGWMDGWLIYDDDDDGCLF